MNLRFRSTACPAGSSSTWGLSEALELGLAPDGGLFVPVEWPSMKIDPSWADLSFPAAANRILEPIFAGDKLAGALDEICTRAFDFPIVLRRVDDRLRVLELFHGPTCAFKDFGARFLAATLNRLGAEGSPRGGMGRRLVLVATSGDTGGAVGSAFSSLTDISVAILFPKGRISKEQEIQLSVWGSSVNAYAVHGAFDDCQALVKQAFQDEELRARFRLISANSINIGRLLPQMAYFAYASLCHLRLEGRPPAGFIIPSGNLGNGTAALWARRLGFPTGKIIFAHNANHAFPDYLQSGKWETHASLGTIANAMDVGAPSNFARIRDLHPELSALRRCAEALSVSDSEIQETVRKSFKETGEIWCPHTATAIHASTKLTGAPWISVATAHPAKFTDVLCPLIGRAPDSPPALAQILSRPPLNIDLQPALADLKAHLLNF